MARKKKSRWKTLLFLLAIALILLSLLATLDIAVFAPARLEKTKQARRDAPPQLVLPSLLDAGSQPEVITAFRVEEWRLPTPEPTEIDPADTYLTGYMAVREAEELVKVGDPEGAREKFEEAARFFETIQSTWPSFETEMVHFRRKKIEDALAGLRSKQHQDVPEKQMPKSGAINRPGDEPKFVSLAAPAT